MTLTDEQRRNILEMLGAIEELCQAAKDDIIEYRKAVEEIHDIVAKKLMDKSFRENAGFDPFAVEM